ncbi:histidine/lysine/arginine/ornithine transporter subunit; ATP-binding component of ABC superfamily [Burkholderiales bacterium 8X]|nr:histidine/lysine/arginine/ornithine transporter subunit; ATP-binding component of ABC superfamily [Burkholderiales bacterium 8X]
MNAAADASAQRVASGASSAEQSAAAPCIRVVGLHKRFGDQEVLKGISFDVHRGTVLSMIGASGSGKSTLLRCINRLETPSAGDILIEGESVCLRNGKPRSMADVNRIRRDLGMVFQQFNLWPHLTVLQNIMEAPRSVRGLSRAEARAVAQECLDRVHLGDKADAYPARLSGGQQQRVAIARALAMRPKVMLFDEATSSLDPELTEEVLAVMRDLAREGTTMIVVTHEMAFAREVSDHVMFLHNGLVDEQGPPADLFSAPRSERLRQFLTRAKA